ncbi:WG repeat-containing protein [Crocinitomicaceae bacterium]|nr:WG repeat-containing protein [Crocinitomicaceae bacterium]
MKNSIVFVAFFTAAFMVKAGKVEQGYKALQQYNYFKAKKKFTKGLKYNSAASAQGLALIYFRDDNPFHNYDSAYFYINKSIQDWPLEKQRRKDKWMVYGFTYDSIVSLRQNISSAFFSIASKINTEQAYISFLENNPWANEVERSTVLRDSIAFYTAVQQNTASSFKAFTEKYPESAYAEQANETYFDLQFAESTSDGSLESFVRFINSNKESPLRLHAEEQLFSMVTAPNSIDSYETFIRDYPENYFVDTAWKLLYQLKLSDFSLNTMQEFLAFDSALHPTILDDIQRYDSLLLPYLADGRYGFMNTSGAVVVSNEYDFTGVFQEGLAVVVKNEKFGFVNKRGELQIPCMYSSANDFVHGLAVVELGDKIGVIDRNGNYRFDCIYDDFGVFSEGLTYASIDGKYGYYNKEGVEVIPHVFDDAYDFQNEMAKVEINGAQTFIRKSGVSIFPPIYEEVERYFDTLFVVKKDGRFGFVNDRGQQVVDLVYESVGALNDDLAIAALDGRIVYLNKQGTIAVDYGYKIYPNFIKKGEFIDGIAVVLKNGKYGRVNLKNELVTAFEFDNIDIGETVIPAQKGEFWGLYNTEGELISAADYLSLERLKNGAFIASKSQGLGVINQQGESMIPFSYNDIEFIGDSLYLVETGGMYGVYLNDEIVVSANYNQIGRFNKEFLFLRQEGSLTYYNIREGKFVQLMKQ